MGVIRGVARKWSSFLHHSFLGMVIVAWPILSGNIKDPSSSVSERSQAYTTAKNLLINGADAIERIMTSFKEVRKTTY